MDSIEKPLVSVLMTCYNRSLFIEESIQSVLNSSYNNIELIIVDDCSTDDSYLIAKKYEKVDNRVSAYLNTINLGDYKNRNQAASYAKGKYLKFVDSDDLIYPWTLDIMVFCMESQPQASFGLEYYDPHMKYPFLLSSEEAYKYYYFGSKLLTMGPTGSIIKKDVFLEFGGFSGSQFIGDTELWLSLLKYHSVLCIPPRLHFWRIHDSQQVQLEKKDFSVELLRFQLDIKLLMDKDCPCTPFLSKKIIENIKSIKCRNLILRTLKNFDINYFLSYSKKYKLTFFDFVRSFFPNHKL